MRTVAAITELLDSRPVREIEPGLLSVLPADAPGQKYDGRARAYDRMIGSRLYNRLFWGTSPADYSAFARQAVGASPSGWLLDAGCGTLLQTAHAYAANPDRPVVALDASLDMLRRGRDRLTAISSRADHVIFLQGDILDLPFAPGRFETVLSMGMLHLFDDVAPLVAGLHRVVRSGGGVFVSSLVANGRFGDSYMRLLHRSGEIAAPRTAAQLESTLAPITGDTRWTVTGNMAYAVATSHTSGSRSEIASLG